MGWKACVTLLLPIRGGGAGAGFWKGSLTSGRGAGGWLSSTLIPASDGNFDDIPDTMTQP